MKFQNIKMNVIDTAENGVVNDQTIFSFTQTENLVTATYSGRQIIKDLVGQFIQDKLLFSFCQLQTNGKLGNGQTECQVLVGENGKIRMIENFKWNSKDGGKGVNVFQEI